jgi:Fur family peroxide stress response transcriptional regulator
MKKTYDILEKCLADFREACERQGLKATHQRLEIYRELASTEEHPDVETIYQGVTKRIPSISRDTVYRNLNLLAEHGLISIVGMSHERLRFDANMLHHHHFVCVKCGRIQDFYSPNLDAIKMPKEAKAFGTPVSLHVEVKGVCAICQHAHQEKP